MTTIAYRNGVLAADTGVGLGDMMLPERFQKIHRLRDGRLFAWTGVAGDGARVLAHFNNPKKPMPEKPDGVALIIDRRGIAWTLEEGAMLRVIGASYVARGSGKDFAYGAMAMGASAREAVKVAARFDLRSRPPVEALRLRDIKR